MSENNVVSTQYVEDLSNRNKTNLIRAINKIIEARKLKQREVAEILDIKQPRVSDMYNEKVEKFSLDTLFDYFVLLGYQIEVEVNETKGKPLTTKISKVS